MARAGGAARSALFLVAFVAAGLLGRLTIIGDTAMALVWPAAGVAVLWRLAGRGAWRWVDLGLIAAATFVVNDVTGSSHAMSGVFAVANLVQVVTVTWLVEAVTPRLPTLRLGAPFTTPRALVRLVAAAVLGCLPPAALGMTGALLVEDFGSWASTFIWWGRNAVGIVGLVSVALLLADPTAVPSRAAGAARAHLAEGAALLALTVALLGLDLAEGELPLAFFLPALTAWAGMRFSSTFVAVHSVLAGGVAVLLTLAGEGPFAQVHSAELAALMSQLFVGMTVVLGLFLTMARRENQVLAADLREARDAFRRQARVLETTIMSMDDGLVVVDPDDRITLVNRSAAGWLFDGVTPPAGTRLRSVGLRRDDGTVIADDDRPSARARRGELVRMDVRPHDPSDPSVYAVTATPLVGDPEEPINGAVMVYHDVSAERAQQRALASYASVVAHDLLNPLSVVSGWAELLEDSFADDERATDALGRIRNATARMRELVHDLLADAQSRDLVLEVQVIDMEALAHDALKGVVDASSVMILPIPPVSGDPRLLRQVLANLVANAVKYAADDRDPEITVSGRVEESGEVVVEVADRGIGIPEEHLASVFESFHRVPGTGRQGTGLGLAICRRIVRRHGGRISAARRTDGPGTVVTMVLPGVAGDSLPV